MSEITLGCQNCGGKTFDTIKKVNSLDDIDGAVCSNCGATFRKREAEIKIKKAINNSLRDSLRKARLK